MNKVNGAISCTKGMWGDRGMYDVPADQEGRSPLTGSNLLDEDYKTRFIYFTCVELEVFALE